MIYIPVPVLVLLGCVVLAFAMAYWISDGFTLWRK